MEAAPANLRRFSRVDALRIGITFLGLGATFAATYFVLPVFQSFALPRSTQSASAPWVIRPEGVFRFGAAAVAGAVMFAFLIRPTGRRWRAADAEQGTRYDPFAGRRARKMGIFIQGMLLFVVYATSLVFYFLSWTTIGPIAIERHLPWGRKQHGYSQIASLESIPTGFRSESLAQDGPWYEIHFDDGSDVSLSLSNEGLSEDRLSAIVRFIAAQSGRSWSVRGDAVRR